MYTARKSVSEAGSDSILFAHKAANMLNSDAVEEAARFCEEGVKRFPFYAEGHYVLARCYQVLKQTEEARKEFERTLYYSPGHLKALKALAYLNYQNKWREKGNAVLLTMAAYDPLNRELMDFLRSENVSETPEPVTQSQQPLSDETLLDFDASEETQTDSVAVQHEPETSSEVASADEVPEAEPALDFSYGEENLPLSEPLEEEQQNREEEALPVEEAAEIPASEPEPALEMETDVLPQIDIPSEAETLLETEPSGKEAPVFEEMSEDVSGEPGSFSEDELNNAVEELFSEDEPAVELTPIQESSGLDLEDITGLTESAEEEREDFERNDIEERLEENEAFNKPLDLDQFDNTEDDFSTLIEGYFQETDEEVLPAEQENNAPADPEQPVEERSFLDTSVIFREKRSEDLEESGEEAFSKDVIDDMNKVADEIELMSTKASFAVEEEIEKSAELHHDQEEEKAVEEQNEIQALDEVIEKIEKAGAPVVKATEKLNAKDIVALEEENVNIEDILQNPSLLTPTFGEILIAQKKFKDARQVFIALSENEPENKRFQKKIEFLDKIVQMQK